MIGHSFPKHGIDFVICLQIPLDAIGVVTPITVTIIRRVIPIERETIGVAGGRGIPDPERKAY